MTNSITIGTNYNAYTVATFDLPEGRTFDDIEQWYVKWELFHYKLDGVWHWEELDDGDGKQLDCKIPTLTVISDADNNDLLAEQE